MQRRKQSVVTLSLESERYAEPQNFSQTDPRSSCTGDAASPTADRGEKLSKCLMALCQEIAGALLSHHAAGSDLRIARERIARRLMETLRCERSRVDKLIELSKELIHANAYGRYRRNPLELSLLIQAAMGQKLFDATNN
jgi:hypothetical protein